MEMDVIIILSDNDTVLGIPIGIFLRLVVSLCDGNIMYDTGSCGLLSMT